MYIIVLPECKNSLLDKMIGVWVSWAEAGGFFVQARLTA